MPQLTNVWIVVLENTSFSMITPQNGPYLTMLQAQGTLMSNYFAVTHPSLPNYIAMVGGDPNGVPGDGPASDPTYQVAASIPDIASQLQAAGLTWHEYSENQPTACALDDNGSDPTKYVSKHDPMTHYLITQQDQSCQTNDVSYDNQGSGVMQGMAADIAAGTFFNYVFISPNLCHDGHDSCAPISDKVGQQDAWLSANIPLILNSSAYKNNGLLIITWDEDDNTGGSNQIMTILLSPMLASVGQPNGTLYSHYSALATIEAGFGLASLPAANGHTDALITDVWK